MMRDLSFLPPKPEISLSEDSMRADHATVGELCGGELAGASRAIDVDDDADYHEFKGEDEWRFVPPDIDEVETIERYGPGGYHPIHIGDEYQDGRYKIIHKLGFGGFSTVWLARDRHTQPGRLVALKAMTASASAHSLDDSPDLFIPRILQDAFQDSEHDFQTVEDHFLVDGTNGSHRFIISALAGPSVLALSECPGRRMGSRRLRGDLARKVAKQTAMALQHMHQTGLVHGDLTTSNILFRVTEELRVLSDAEVYRHFWPPVTDEVRMWDEGQPLGPEVPKEVVEPLKYDALIRNSFLQEAVTIVDFGQSYVATALPKNYKPGTITHYTPPEMRFEQRVGLEADVWMLGCAIFEMRVGYPLFYSFIGDDLEVLRNVVETLGRLPDPWWSAYEDRTEWFEENGTAKRVDKVPDIRARLKMVGTQDGEPREEEGYMIEKNGVQIEDGEVDLLENLLLKMLRYRPQDRLPLQDVLSHDWFAYRNAKI